MNMHIFQVESNKVLPQVGSLLIASPLLYDYHFARTVVLMITHDSEGSMGIVMNKDFRYHITLHDLVPKLKSVPTIPVYKGGPVDRDTIFFIHTLSDLEGALDLGNGLYLNGNFDRVQEYILAGNDIEGHIRFFAGYAGWKQKQLEKEIEENSWIIGETDKKLLLDYDYKDLWQDCMSKLGTPYELWSKYPQYPSCN
ncbi:YqgE/AlgH family protein [uncultured Bacteroides sp.]|uniref:YqgE/AlgH family protein n=1 Tax=uncultured Bacteroides sp. TaxID=162156 RepID=UPI00261F6324|nr:YqgE/AlgH family protein [uncultured Bacteroides sp.]